MGMASVVLQQVSNLGKRIGSGLLDLAVPMTCHGCRAPVSAPGGLCPECWGQLELVSAPVCDVYGTPMSHDAGPGAVSARAIEMPRRAGTGRAVPWCSMMPRRRSFMR
jgi:hypothetical protein